MDKQVNEIYGRDELSKVQFGSDWYESRGYEYADNESYMSYSDKELMALAKSGDPVAEIQAISRFRVFEQHHPEIEKLHESAVLRGMTASLSDMIGLYLLKHESGRASGSTEQGASLPDEGSILDDLLGPGRETALMKASVWALFAQMRGDPSGIQIVRNLQGDTMLALSDERLKTACSVANQLYMKLESKRLELGYSEYSNDAPRLSYSDLGTSPDLCDSWPTHRFACVRESVRSEGIHVMGYRCVPSNDNPSVQKQ